MIPGIEPSGTNTEQIKEAAASREKWSGVSWSRVAAIGTAGAGRAPVLEIGAGAAGGGGGGADLGGGGGGGGAALPGATPVPAAGMTGAGAAAGMVMVFWQVGQAIWVPR